MRAVGYNCYGTIRKVVIHRRLHCMIPLPLHNAPSDIQLPLCGNNPAYKYKFFGNENEYPDFKYQLFYLHPFGHKFNDCFGIFEGIIVLLDFKKCKRSEKKILYII